MPPTGGAGGAGSSEGFVQPTYYRPIPGNRNQYYDVATGEQKSKYYVMKYRRSLTPEQLEFLRNVSSETQARERSSRNDFLIDQWAIRQTGLAGMSYNPAAHRVSASRSQQFRDAYQNLRYQQWAVNYRNGSTDPQGPLAMAMVEMGLRMENDPYPPGQSPPGRAGAVRTIYTIMGDSGGLQQPA